MTRQLSLDLSCLPAARAAAAQIIERYGPHICRDWWASRYVDIAMRDGYRLMEFHDYSFDELIAEGMELSIRRLGAIVSVNASWLAETLEAG
jgi:hypothetical protein